MSGVFDQYDKLLVLFPRPNPDFFPDSSIKIYVEIADPRQDKTIFEIEFGIMFGKPAPPEIELVSNNGSLIVNEPLTEVGEIIDYPGARAHAISRDVMSGDGVDSDYHKRWTKRRIHEILSI